MDGLRGFLSHIRRQVVNFRQHSNQQPSALDDNKFLEASKTERKKHKIETPLEK